jgi:trk system potassium uptake protein TrkA
MRIILVGGDKTVYFLARQFVRRHYHVTIINRDAARGHELAERTKATVVQGEGTDANRLEEAGARQADAVLALTSHDQDNLIVCQIAAKRFGVPRTIALVNDPDNEEIFHNLGVQVAFSATRIIGSMIEQETDFDNITSLMPLAHGRVNVNDVRIDASSPAVGQSLIELDLAPDSLVACILRRDEVILPRGTTRIQAGDHLVLINYPQNEKHDIEVLCGSPRH